MDYCVREHNLGWHVQQWCERSASSPIIYQMDDKNNIQSWSFSQVFIDSRAWADFFASKGIVAGDRVAMISPKSTDHFLFFYACWYLGAIAVPICETFGKPEMTFVIGDCQPKLIIVDKAYAKRVEDANESKIQTVSLTEMPHGCCPHCISDRKVSEASWDDVAALIYTSGSTGNPKGVMLTHRNLIINADSAQDAFRVDSTHKLISLLPYWHSYALVCEVLTCPMAGSAVIVPRDMRDFKKNLAAYAPTCMLVVPRVIETFKTLMDKKIESMPEKKKNLINKAIYNASRIFTARPKKDGGILRMFTHKMFYDPLVFSQFRKVFGGKLKFVVSGGAPLDLELQIFFKFLGIPVLQGYGLTESSPVVSSNRVKDHLLGSIGKVMRWLTPEQGGDYTFKDEEGNMGKDVHGQLLIKGDCVMKGYWNHTDASAKSFENGWLNTGDVGYEHEGFLFIDGRKGNMIVLQGGEKLHPEAVEDVVKDSKYLIEAMVIGEKCKNVYVLANVHKELREKYTMEELHKLVKDDIIALSSQLAPYQKPKDVLILPDFNVEDGTMTATLKVRRFQILKKYGEEIERFLKDCGEEEATKHEVGIASSKVMASLADAVKK